MPKTLWGWSNFLLFQWFFVRLQRTCDVETGRIISLDWIGPVVPLTGWWSDYIFLGNKHANL